MANSALREEIISAFKLHGFSLKSDATRYLIQVIQDVGCSTDRDDLLQRIINAVYGHPLESPSINKEIIETVVRQCGNRMDDENQVFTVQNAFQLAKYEYDPNRKKFVERRDLNLPSPQLYGSADDKANVFRERFWIVYQRLLRHELFAPLTLDIGQQGNSNRYQLLTVEAMLASPSLVEHVIVFGMVSQLKEDKFYLEDPTGAIHVDMSQADFQPGLYTENCLCLIEGSYEENTLMATAVGFAPIESSSCTFSHHFTNTATDADTMLFSSMKNSQTLLTLEQERSDASLIMLSDVWLDSAVVLDKIEKLFNGFSGLPPVAIIFAGDFLSKHYGTQEPKILKDGFKQLGDLVHKYPAIAEKTHFVFVPSLRDPFLTAILPRPPLPNAIVQNFASKVSHCHFTTNPCHIRYCTQNIVILREDIVEKMCRNSIRAPENGERLEKQFAKTILAQSHLLPLPLHVSPVYWSYDYTLRLYPLPDLVVCCDKYMPYTESMNECIISNPGSFARNNYSFQVYLPASRQIEDSEIKD